MTPVRADLAPRQPTIHLAPPTGWMNDPNGLSYLDGRWHAFYQHHPNDDVWGPMHWRHASSVDLLHWSDHGIALAPVALGAIFSGSLVVDHEDTAGFGAGARIAVFTFAGVDQSQGIAWSHNGLDWAFFDGNPVLANPGVEDFRDPKVVRFDQHWVMALAVGERMQFYRSPNLTDWELVGHHQPSTPVAGTIECPDLMAITTEAGEAAFILSYCDSRGGTREHGATMAVAGSFDGETFSEWAPPALLDVGPDFYAAQSFAESPAAAPTILGWMNSWRYANEHPSAGRRGVLSLPRHLSVRSRREPMVSSTLGVPLPSASPIGAGWHATPDAALVGSVQSGGLRICSQAGEALAVRVGVGSTRIDRADIGLGSFGVELEIEHGPGAVHFVIDHGTFEAFFPNGKTASMLVFAGPDWSIELGGAATAAVVN